MSGYGDARMTIPSVRCSARNRRGEPCRLYVRPGSTVCRYHWGNAPQTVNKAMVRQTLATLLASDPRPWQEVILDAVHTGDALHRDARLRLSEEDTITAESLARLAETAKLAHAMGTTAVTSKAVSMRVQQVELEARLIGRILDTFMSVWLATLKSTLDEPRYRAMLKTIRPALVHALRRYAWETSDAKARLAAGAPEPPELPPAPFRLRIVPPRPVVVPVVDRAALVRQPRALTARPAVLPPQFTSDGPEPAGVRPDTVPPGAGLGGHRMSATFARQEKPR